MKYQFVWAYKDQWSIKRMCDILKVSRAAYYKWLRNKDSKKRDNDVFLIVKIYEAFEQSRGTYGSRRIAVELKSQNIIVGVSKISRLMHETGLRPKAKRKFKVTTNSNHNLPVAPNLLKIMGKPTRVNMVWVADITYIWTREGWLYLSTILDLYSRKVVAWEVSSRQKKSLVIDTINKAIKQRKPAPRLIFHSDRGGQYANPDVGKLLEDDGIKQSMSSTGNCYDNAAAESFFHTLKTELVYYKQYQSRREAELSIFDYIECFYNRTRRHSSLKYMSPEEFEMSSFIS